MAERVRIARYFAPLTLGEPGSLSLTDDAAVLTPPPGQQLVITTDSVIEGVHVFAGATPQQFAQKLVRRNLSDLAAMGARPWRYTINMHLPHGLNDSWVEAFTRALQAEQERFGMVLVGGDSTSAPATAIQVTMTCFGLTAQPLLRTGAQAGDDIYVSGTLGDAALGLMLLQLPTPPADWAAGLIARYHVPEPRLALGAVLAGHVTATIDLSDGLAADLAQLLALAECGARIDTPLLPLSPAAQAMLEHTPLLLDTVLQGGDDYELCFTASPFKRAVLAELAQQAGIAITRIGQVTAEPGLLLIDVAGNIQPLEPRGFEHA